MSYISDFKSASLSLFKQATSTSAGTGNLDPSLSTAIGHVFALEDGREVRLVSNGATALASGVLVQGSAIVANHQNLTVAVPAAYPATAGTFQVSVTIGATKLNLNQYAQGFLVVNAGTGIGQTLKISSNTNGAASASAMIITLEDAIVTTLDATSKVCLIANPYEGCVINPTTSTATPVGVTLYPIAAATANTYDGTTGALSTTGVAQYGFVVSKGISSCLADATVANVGTGISPSTTTAGAITSSGGSAALVNIGRALQTTVSAEARAVFLDL